MVDMLFISASPIKDRNNDHAVKRMQEIAREEGFKFFDTMHLSEIKTHPCIDCNHCGDGKDCYMDEVNEVNKRLVNARSIIISSPVYFGSMPAQLKALIDRTRPLRRHNFKLKNKIGAVTAIGGSRNGGQELTIQSIHSWMHIQGMIIVGDNHHFGGALKVPIMEDDVGLKTLEDTVRKVAEVLKITKNE